MAWRSDDDKLIVNRIKVEPATHRFWLEMANQRGMSIEDMMALILDEQAGHWEPPKEWQKARALFWTWVQFERKSRNVQRIYQMAARYQELGESEELADLIEAQCEAAGIDLADLMLQVGTDPLSSVVAHSRGGTKFDECMRWLGRTIRAAGGEMRVSEIQQLGMLEGYKKPMLDRCKRYLEDSPHSDVIITSSKPDKWWVWTLVEKNTGEPVKVPSVKVEADNANDAG